MKQHKTQSRHDKTMMMHGSLRLGAVCSPSASFAVTNERNTHTNKHKQTERERERERKKKERKKERKKEIVRQRETGRDSSKRECRETPPTSTIHVPRDMCSIQVSSNHQALTSPISWFSTQTDAHHVTLCTTNASREAEGKQIKKKLATGPKKTTSEIRTDY